MPLLYNSVPDLNEINLTGANGQAIVIRGPWPANVSATASRLAQAFYPGLVTTNAPTQVFGSLGTNTSLGTWKLA